MPYNLEKVIKRRKPVFKQLLDYYTFCDKECRFSQKTMDFKTHCINDFVKFSKISRIEDITNKQVSKWVEAQEKRGCSGRTVNHRLYQLKVMLKWQRDDNVVIPELKLARIKMCKEEPPRKVFFTREQIDKALGFADQREWLMIRLAFDCGLRISELRNIKLSDIHDRKIKVIGKGRKLRFVIMSEETRKRLDSYITREHITGYLWPSPANNSTPICDQGLRKMMKRPFATAGFDYFRPHDLRHSYATELKTMGIPTRKIQVGLGHSTEAITEQYLSDLDGSEIEEIYAKRYSMVETIEQAQTRAQASNAGMNPALFEVLSRYYVHGCIRDGVQPTSTELARMFDETINEFMLKNSTTR